MGGWIVTNKGKLMMVLTVGYKDESSL
jgi:hypothetical protein